MYFHDIHTVYRNYKSRHGAMVQCTHAMDAHNGNHATYDLVYNPLNGTGFPLWRYSRRCAPLLQRDHLRSRGTSAWRQLHLDYCNKDVPQWPSHTQRAKTSRACGTSVLLHFFYRTCYYVGWHCDDDGRHKQVIEVVNRFQSRMVRRSARMHGSIFTLPHARCTISLS